MRDPTIFYIYTAIYFAFGAGAVIGSWLEHCHDRKRFTYMPVWMYLVGMVGWPVIGIKAIHEIKKWRGFR